MEKKQVFYKGEQCNLYSETIDNLKWSGLAFKKNDCTIYRTTLETLQDDKVLTLDNEDVVLYLKNKAWSKKHFLALLPSERSKEIIFYVRDRSDSYFKKTERILEWAKTVVKFDTAFVEKVHEILASYNEITLAQEKAIDNIIEKWRIPIE